MKCVIPIHYGTFSVLIGTPPQLKDELHKPALAEEICDLYAFPSPQYSGHLVLVLNVLPKATSDSHFSEAIVYRFRLRPVTIAGVGGATAFPFAGEDQELVFTCHFGAPRQFLP
jgi:hypothetical protein